MNYRIEGGSLPAVILTLAPGEVVVGEGLFDTVITGPGKVYLQTMTVEKLAQLLIPYMPHDDNN